MLGCSCPPILRWVGGWLPKLKGPSQELACAHFNTSFMLNLNMVMKIYGDKIFEKVIKVVMYDYVHWHCSIDYCVKISLIDKNLCENCIYFTLK